MKTSVTILFLLTAILGYSQNILVVDNNPEAAADYTSLSDAVNNAEAGDFIYLVPSSTSYGGAIADVEVHIRGLAHRPEATNGLNATVGSITLNGNNSSISGVNSTTGVFGSGNGVEVSNCRMNYMTVSGDNWTIEGNVINNTQANVSAINVNDSQNVTIHHNYIRKNSPNINVAAIAQAPESTFEFNNIYVLDHGRLLYDCINTTFQNSVILSLEEGDNLVFQASSGWSFVNCLSYNYNGFAVPLTGPGENNLEDTDPQFEFLQNDTPIFSYNNNYTPAAGSPLIGAASDGDNIGIYNDNFDFDQNGYAIDLPHITSISILNPSVEEGEELEVNFSAFGN